MNINHLHVFFLLCIFLTCGACSKSDSDKSDEDSVTAIAKRLGRLTCKCLKLQEDGKLEKAQACIQELEELGESYDDKFSEEEEEEAERIYEEWLEKNCEVY